LIVSGHHYSTPPDHNLTQESLTFESKGFIAQHDPAFTFRLKESGRSLRNGIIDKEEIDAMPGVGGHSGGDNPPNRNTEIAPDYTFNGLPISAKRTRTWAKRKRTRYRNLPFRIEDLRAQGESVSFAWTMQGNDTESAGLLVVRRGRTEVEFRAGRCVSNAQRDVEMEGA
jgi:hypothetical protein